jgi:hypothetical protein
MTMTPRHCEPKAKRSSGQDSRAPALPEATPVSGTASRQGSFVSFVLANSGPEYAEFLFDASHSVFSNDAIRAHVMNERDKPFWGYRITERKPEIGDIVHRNRSGGTFTYEYAENHAHFESHSDIVCEVRGAVARVVGGNTGGGEGTVAMGEYHRRRGFPGRRAEARRAVDEPFGRNLIGAIRYELSISLPARRAIP